MIVFLLLDVGYVGLVIYCIFFGMSMGVNGGFLIFVILMEMFG